MPKGRGPRWRALTGAAGLLLPGLGGAWAADVPANYQIEEQPRAPRVCGAPEETVILFEWDGVPTVPGRTPYFYCVTNETLLPGEIPPPPEYCCG